MQDIGFFAGNPWVDLAIENGDLKGDDTLETAVLISLFTDRREEIEELPEGETDPRGWFGDELSEKSDDKIGSLIWISDRGKTDSATMNRIEDSVRDALQWLIDDGIADRVEVSVERRGDGGLISVGILRPGGDNIPFKFLWDAQSIRGVAA